MKIIQLNESKDVINAIETLIEDIQLLKTNKGMQLYKLKNADIYICIVNTFVYAVKYNTQIVKNLYQANNLSCENLIQLYYLNVFM